MNFTVTIDHKFVFAFGAVVCGVIFFEKMPPDTIERVLIHGINAYKESKTIRSDRV